MKLFLPSLKAVRRVTQNQLKLAKEAHRHVEKIVLTGGFGQSPSLKSYLEVFLQDRAKISGLETHLIVPRNP